MNERIVSALKVSAAALCLAVATGCVGPQTQQKIDDAYSTAQRAAQDAASAKQAADSANSSASEAKQMAASAQSAADRAQRTANEAQACCDRNSEKIERMFKKSMSK